MRRSAVADEESIDKNQPMRSFGTVLSRGGTRREALDRSNITGKNKKNEGGQRVALSVYKDENGLTVDQLRAVSVDAKAWSNLAGQKDRNKENNAIPSKWTSHKIPQKVASRGSAVTPRIEVFVDDECPVERPSNGESQNSSNLQPTEGEEKVFKRESDRLRQNPLLNFPACSLLR